MKFAFEQHSAKQADLKDRGRFAVLLILSQPVFSFASRLLQFSLTLHSQSANKKVADK